MPSFHVNWHTYVSKVVTPKSYWLKYSFKSTELCSETIWKEKKALIVHACLIACRTQDEYFLNNLPDFIVIWKHKFQASVF